MRICLMNKASDLLIFFFSNFTPKLQYILSKIFFWQPRIVSQDKFGYVPWTNDSTTMSAIP